MNWGTHICIGKLTIIGSDNGLLPRRWQIIIWTSIGILLIGPLGTNFSEILLEVQTLKKITLKMSSVKCCPFHFSLNVLSHLSFYVHFISHILCYFLENHHNIGRCHQGLIYLDIIFKSNFCYFLQNRLHIILSKTSSKSTCLNGSLTCPRHLKMSSAKCHQTVPFCETQYVKERSHEFSGKNVFTGL